MEQWDLIVIGGGAAGYFGAIACAEAFPGARVLILEATPRILTKVKISGGGRCNVTHNQFDPKQLITCYPRGRKELLGPFHSFQPQDTIHWFSEHGVKLKAESDGRMFPTTNKSQTIIDCLTSAAHKAGVVLRTNTLVQNITPHTESGYNIEIKSNLSIHTNAILLATGSMPYGVSLAKKLGHSLVSPVPSLFTFQIENSLLKDMQGISFSTTQVQLKIPNSKQTFQQTGPCLITHWGLSGPAVLKLSAFAARELYKSNYLADLQINWLFPLTKEDVLHTFKVLRQKSPKKKIKNENPFSCVKRFWDAILRETNTSEKTVLAGMSKKQIDSIADLLTQTKLQVTGKGVFKEEFVTAGGVAREDINFRTMESKKCPGVYFAGEIIDIDGITGGFNFQNAWTGGWLAGQAISKNLPKTYAKTTLLS